LIPRKVAILSLLAGISFKTTALENQINLNQSTIVDILPSSVKIGDEIDISVNLSLAHFRDMVDGFSL